MAFQRATGIRDSILSKPFNLNFGAYGTKNWLKNNFSIIPCCTGDERDVLAKTCIMSESQNENFCVERMS